MRRAMVGVVAGMAALLALAPGSASANLLWCMSDPPQQVTTSSGTNLTVNVNLYAPSGDKKLLNSVTETTTTAPDGAGGTLVTVEVQVPSTISELGVRASVQRYNVSAFGSGPTGSLIVLTMDVPTA